MLFTSYDFALFFLITLTAYWGLPPRARLPVLLVAGYVFYGAWDYRFLGLLFFTTCVDFVAGIAIHAATDPPRRKLFLLLSIGTNLTVLGFFKYWNFFIDSFAVVLERFGMLAHLPTLRIILPVGISFYTFQSMAYTIDVYRRRVVPSRDFLHYATYVAFFPQLVAGPIERFEHLMAQNTDALGDIPFVAPDAPVTKLTAWEQNYQRDFRDFDEIMRTSLLFDRLGELARLCAQQGVRLVLLNNAVHPLFSQLLPRGAPTTIGICSACATRRPRRRFRCASPPPTASALPSSFRTLITTMYAVPFG